MKKFISFLINVIFWIFQRFAIFSAIAVASYNGTGAGMILHGLFWPYKALYWLIKNLTLNTGFRDGFGEIASAIWNGMIGLPTNAATRPIFTLVLVGFFILVHFIPGPIKKIKNYLRDSFIK